MQHVWVEAAVDFFPSRGAVNRAADSWVPMDPSFKQYEYLQGLDPVAISGLDPEALADAFLATGTVNEAEGWVTGFDPAVLQDAQLAAAQALEDHIDTHLPDATVGDVLGGRRIVEHAPPIFAGTLATEVLTVGARHASLPDSLRQHMTFALAGGHSVTLRWAEINNERITLSFRPATPADEAALLSLLPEGEITDISQLPNSIPSYLVRVVPELKLGDSVILQGDALNLGHEVRFSYTPRLTGGRIGAANPYNVIAGSYLAVAAIAGNVGLATIQASQAHLYESGTRLESISAGLTANEYLGHLFHAGLLSYYSQYIRTPDRVRGSGSRGYHYLAGGVGSMGYEPNLHTVLGLPLTMHGGGIVMNIPILNVFGYDDTAGPEGIKNRVDYIMQVGMLSSALEHKVPEDMFVSAFNGVHGISATKAIATAIVEGQKLYQVTPENWSELSIAIEHDSLVENEMRSAIQNGRWVITHASPIHTPGWTGAGYIIFDPATGDAAYKIGGGSNGAYLFIGLALIGLMMWMVAVATIALAAVSGPFAPVVVGYGAVLEYQLILQAFRFAERIRDIAISNCDAETKAQLAKDTLFMIFIQALVTRLANGAQSIGISSGTRDFLEEVIRLFGVTGGLGVLDQFRIARTDQVLDRCR